MYHWLIFVPYLSFFAMHGLSTSMANQYKTLTNLKVIVKMWEIKITEKSKKSKSQTSYVKLFNSKAQHLHMISILAQ